MNRYLTLAIALLFLAVGFMKLSAAGSETDQWRTVLAFDVMDTHQDQKADLGGSKLLVASWYAGLGWDVGVFTYPRTESSLNLLYDGHNWHGIQPWMVFAWSKHTGTYPDERVIPYERGRSKLKIVLIGCETRQIAPNSYEFLKGRVEIFHSP